MRAFLVALLLVHCGCAAPQPHDRGHFSIDTARLVFNGRYAGGSDLYILDRGSGRVERLTNFQAQGRGANGVDHHPEAGFVFQVVQRGNYDIYRLAAPGSDATAVETSPAFDLLPKWAPTAKTIALMSSRGLEPGRHGPFPGHVYVKDLDGGQLHQVTRVALGSSLGPTDVAPDGSSLLIARETDSGLDVFELSVTSGEERRLTRHPANEYSASYSHDGQWIAYQRETGSESQIVVQRRSDGAVKVLTTGPGHRYYPAWSPDDRWLVYSASDDGDQYDLRMVALAGGDEIVLLATPEDEREAVFIAPR